MYLLHVTLASQVAQWLKKKEKKNETLSANAGDVRYQGSIPGSRRSPRGGNGTPFQYSCLDNPMDRSLAGYSSMGWQRVGHNGGMNIYLSLHTILGCRSHVISSYRQGTRGTEGEAVPLCHICTERQS